MNIKHALTERKRHNHNPTLHISALNNMSQLPLRPVQPKQVHWKDDRLINIKYIEADTEAEIICSQLCKRDKVYACLSDDTDILANGSKIFLTGYNYKKNNLIKYDYTEILKELKLTNIEFVDLCILCGCDYTHTIGGLGPVTGYKLLKENKNIEGVLEKIKYLN